MIEALAQHKFESGKVRIDGRMRSTNELNNERKHMVEKLYNNKLEELKADDVDNILAKDAQNKANKLAIELAHLQGAEISLAHGEQLPSGLVAIKTKLSRSEWYTKGGAYNSRSEYVYCVPKRYEGQARELYEIRKSMQGNKHFNFADCEINYTVVRFADH